MKRINATARVWLPKAAAMMMLLFSAAAIAVAQPPERPQGPPERGGTFGGSGAGREGPGALMEGRGPAGSREGRGGPGMREGRGGAGSRFPGGPPSPERFVEHAMKFDADGDGKLDREELTKFAEEMQRMRGGGGPGVGRGGAGGRGPGGPEGFRGPDGPRGPSEDDFERERPPRPE